MGLLGFPETADLLYNRLRSLQSIAQMISAYEIFHSHPPDTAVPLWTTGTSTICRCETTFPYSRELNQVREWRESCVALAKSAKHWLHASQVFKCFPTTLASIERCVVVGENTATALMMQIKGHLGVREVMVRETQEAIAAVRRFWQNYINNRMYLQLVRTGYFKRLETGGSSPSIFEGKSTPLSGNTLRFCIGRYHLPDSGRLLRSSMRTHILRNTATLLLPLS